MPTIFEFLSANNITYKSYQHPPIFTCEQAIDLAKGIPGFATKNLFLRSKNAEHLILVALPEYKKLNIKNLEKEYGYPKLSFAGEELLDEYLKVKPGSVTLLGLINDKDKRVSVFVDKDVWEADQVQCHPLVNTATLVIPKEDLKRFFGYTGHAVKVSEF